MKKIMLAVAAVMLALTFTPAPVAEAQRTTGVKSGLEQTAPEVSLRITDRRGREIKITSLSREEQAKVERIKKAAESLRAELGTTAAMKWHLECSGPPLRCHFETAKN